MRRCRVRVVNAQVRSGDRRLVTRMSDVWTGAPLLGKGNFIRTLPHAYAAGDDTESGDFLRAQSDHPSYGKDTTGTLHWKPSLGSPVLVDPPTAVLRASTAVSAASVEECGRRCSRGEAALVRQLTESASTTSMQRSEDKRKDTIFEGPSLLWHGSEASWQQRTGSCVGDRDQPEKWQDLACTEDLWKDVTIDAEPSTPRLERSPNERRAQEKS